MFAVAFVHFNFNENGEIQSCIFFYNSNFSEFTMMHVDAGTSVL